jgi:hypothetical protein
MFEYILQSLQWNKANYQGMAHVACFGVIPAPPKQQHKHFSSDGEEHLHYFLVKAAVAAAAAISHCTKPRRAQSGVGRASYGTIAMSTRKGERLY